MAVVHGGDYLPEEVSRLPLAQAPALADVVIQLALAGVLHHDYDFVFVLKHWKMIRKKLESINIYFQENTSILKEREMGGQLIKSFQVHSIMLKSQMDIVMYKAE